MPERRRGTSTRFSVACAAFTLLLGLVAPAASGYGGFGDVSRDRFYADAVAWMARNDIANGVSPGCFGPNGRTTRGQAVAFLWRFSGTPGASAHRFGDIEEGWQQGPVSWAAARGITTGQSPTRFGPDEDVTRGEAITFLWRMAGSPGGSADHPFRDVSRSWQHAAVAWASSRGLVKGTSASTFEPERPITRGEFATILWRYAGSPVVSGGSDAACANPAGGGSFAPPVSVPPGFPTAQTTGIAAAGLRVGDLRPSGSLTIDRNGTVIDGLDINGVVRVTADNVVIRNSRILHSSFLGVVVEDGASNLLVENVTIVGTANSAGANIGFSNFTCRRCDLSGATDGVKVGSNVVIEDSYIHDLRKYSGAHNDGIQHSGGGTSVHIRRNTILGPFQTSTSAVLAQTNAGPISDLHVYNNFLYGGSYTVYLRDKGNGNGAPINSSVDGNVFAASTSGVFAACDRNGGSAASCNSYKNTVSLSGGVSFDANIFHNGAAVR